jgi:hypothetical protein
MQQNDPHRPHALSLQAPAETVHLVNAKWLARLDRAYPVHRQLLLECVEGADAASRRR